MSTQYEFMKRQVVEEVAALQEKLIAIQADCINRIKEIPVTSDLEPGPGPPAAVDRRRAAGDNACPCR